jgi:hypothetical protein
MTFDPQLIWISTNKSLSPIDSSPFEAFLVGPEIALGWNQIHDD